MIGHQTEGWGRNSDMSSYVFTRVTRLLGALSLLCLAFISWAQPLTKEQKDAVLKGVEDVVVNRAFVPGVDFKKWPEFIAKHQEALEKAEDAAAFAGAINRALREFGLSHIRLQTPRAAASRNQTTAIGTGASVTKRDEGLEVRGVNENASAKAAGLQPGDVITKVNGQKADDPSKLEGEKGSKVEVEVKKANGETKTVTLERTEYSTVRKETLTWVDEETAVLRVFTFAAGYGRQNIETLMTEAAKAKYLVLDLRNNGGGATNNLNHLLSLLLPDQTPYGVFVNRTTAARFAEETKKDPNDPIAIAQWSSAQVKTRARTTVPPFSGKIAVLINRGSGSASENAAAALRESASAPLVGSRTAGAVLASIFRPLPEGFAIQFPVSDFVTAKGVRLEKNPLVPDIEVTTVRNDQSDPARDKAIEKLKSGG